MNKKLSYTTLMVVIAAALSIVVVFKPVEAPSSVTKGPIQEMSELFRVYR